MTDQILIRPMAMIGEVLCVSVPQGTPIFNTTEQLLGTVSDGKPVVNDHTVYLSTDDYRAAKQAIADTGTVRSI